MAGHGPPPKDPAKRARTNKAPEPLRVIIAEPAAQPPLPASMPGDEPWPEQTRTWWQVWKDSPLSSEFTTTDWSYLLDTAVTHGRLWSGDMKAAAELRLRVERFGATPVDRARLRITFAQADEADGKVGSRASSSKDRHPGLKLAE